MKINGRFLLVITFLFFSASPAVLVAQDGLVKLVGHYNPPAGINDDNVILLKGINSGEYLEIIIEGTVYEFEHLQLGFEGEGDDFRIVEKGSLNKPGTLSNRTLIIETYLPEGIPSERIKWKDGSGTAYQYDFYESGTGENEWSFDIYDAPSYWPLSFLDYSHIADPVIKNVTFSEGDLVSPGGIYPVGWSKDGKFAYVEAGYGSNAGLLAAPVSLRILDMITDRIVYESSVSSEDSMNVREQYNFDGTGDPLLEVEEAWKSIAGDFEKELAGLGIKKIDALDFLTFPLHMDGETYNVIPAAQERSSRDISFLSEYEIQIEKVSAGRKVICSGGSDENDPLMEIIIYGAFKSPFENRIAVLYGLKVMGKEEPYWGQEDQLNLYLSGCHLGVGFQ